MSIRINRVYTKGGDGGETSLVGGTRLSKDAPRIDAYGTVDELNAILGLVRQANRTEAGPDAARGRLDALLERVQQELFNLGSLMATPADALTDTQPRIREEHVAVLEREIDELNQALPELRSFTLPGGGWTSSYLHLARTVCRRAERLAVALARTEEISPEVVRYLNRLSDALFVIGRWNARQRGEAEPLWDPGRGGAARRTE